MISRNILLTIITIMILGFALNAWANESSLKSLNKERFKAINNINQEYENKLKKLSGKNYFAVTFPTEHPSNAISASFDDFGIFIWRENGNIWIEAEPYPNEDGIYDGVFICSSSFRLIQNNIQLSNIRIEDEPESSFCTYLYIPIILRLTTSEYAQVQFDPDETFTLSYNTYKVEFPASSEDDPGSSEDDPGSSEDDPDNNTYKDSDNDGVIDEWDNCPDTASGTPTDKYGCKVDTTQYQSGYDEGFAAGQEECPECEDCTQEFTQEDLDAQYEKGKEAGLAECENLSIDQTNSVTVDENLRISIPYIMIGDTPFKLKFKYLPNISCQLNYYWKLDSALPIK